MKGLGKAPLIKHGVLFGEPLPVCEDGTVLGSRDCEASPPFYGVGVIREL